MKDISPEEKLLRLIKAGKTSSPTHLPLPLDIPRDKKIATNISLLKPGIKNMDIRKLLILLLAISFLYLVASFVYPWAGLKKIKLPDVPEERVRIEEPETELKEEPKPYEFYLQGLSQRQIFSSPSAAEGINASPLASADLVKDINLVGIISGVNPQAVVEDKKTQKTYYLNKGQFIGELQIEDIQEGKIIVNYNGQKYELYL